MDLLFDHRGLVENWATVPNQMCKNRGNFCHWRNVSNSSRKANQGTHVHWCIQPKLHEANNCCGQCSPDVPDFQPDAAKAATFLLLSLSCTNTILDFFPVKRNNLLSQNWIEGQFKLINKPSCSEDWWEKSSFQQFNRGKLNQDRSKVMSKPSSSQVYSFIALRILFLFSGKPEFVDVVTVCHD